ncbi:MAG: hypothetical protein AVDCRST_MAG88-3257, partial [uncultured Thermomicrobiales bacterium]
ADTNQPRCPPGGAHAAAGGRRQRRAVVHPLRRHRDLSVPALRDLHPRRGTRARHDPDRRRGAWPTGVAGRERPGLLRGRRSSRRAAGGERRLSRRDGL